MVCRRSPQNFYNHDIKKFSSLNGIGVQLGYGKCNRKNRRRSR